MKTPFAIVLTIALCTAAAHAQVTSFNGRTGIVTLQSADVTGALGYTPVNKAGDTMTGILNGTGGAFSGNMTIGGTLGVTSAATLSGGGTLAGAWAGGTLNLSASTGTIFSALNPLGNGVTIDSYPRSGSFPAGARFNSFWWVEPLLLQQQAATDLPKAA